MPVWKRLIALGTDAPKYDLQMTTSVQKDVLSSFLCAAFLYC